jgi:hypothetical protein
MAEDNAQNAATTNASASQSTSGMTNIGGLTPPNTTVAPSAAPTVDVEKVKRDAAKAAKAEAEAAFKAMLDEAAQNEAREKLDAQAKAEAERDEARTKLAEAEARAAKVEHDAKVHRHLISAGVPAEHVDRVALMVTAEPGASDDDIDAAIQSLRDLGIGVFASKPDGTAQVVPAVRPSTPPPARTQGDGIDPARQRARERHGYKPVSAA